jgi:small GTP-binding protein
VGKTQLINRVADDSFSPNVAATTGVGFKCRTSEIDGIRFRVQIWDTPGLEHLRDIAKACVMKADQVVLVCDMSDPQSLEQSRIDFADFYEQHPAQAKRPLPALLVNKTDLPGDRSLLRQAGDFARRKGMKCSIGSAKLGEGVRGAFTAIADAVYRFYMDPTIVISCVVVGDRRTGKKNLFSRLFWNEFSEVYKPRSGIQYMYYGVGAIGDQRVRVAIIPFSGAEGLEQLQRSRAPADEVVVVYDLSDPESFERIQQWMSAVRGFLRRSRETPPSVRIFVVGNKLDLTSESSAVAVSKPTNRRGDLRFIDVSAKRGDNIDVLFDAIAKWPAESWPDAGKGRRSK